MYAPIKRPEDPGCRMDKELLEEWRKRHGVKVAEHRVETLEERLAASIASYRKIGNHTRADALEVQLAELRGESLVTLPPRPEVQKSEPMPVSQKATHKMPVSNCVTDIDPDYGDEPIGEDFGDE